MRFAIEEWLSSLGFYAEALFAASTAGKVLVALLAMAAVAAIAGSVLILRPKAASHRLAVWAIGTQLSTLLFAFAGCFWVVTWARDDIIRVVRSPFGDEPRALEAFDVTQFALRLTAQCTLFAGAALTATAIRAATSWVTRVFVLSAGCTVLATAWASLIHARAIYTELGCGDPVALTTFHHTYFVEAQALLRHWMRVLFVAGSIGLAACIVTAVWQTRRGWAASRGTAAAAIGTLVLGALLFARTRDLAHDTLGDVAHRDYWSRCPPGVSVVPSSDGAGKRCEPGDQNARSYIALSPRSAVIDGFDIPHRDLPGMLKQKLELWRLVNPGKHFVGRSFIAAPPEMEIRHLLPRLRELRTGGYESLTIVTQALPATLTTATLGPVPALPTCCRHELRLDDAGEPIERFKTWNELTLAVVERGAQGGVFSLRL